MAERKIKSFDEVMKSIKNKNYKELKGVSEQLDGVEKLRVDAIIEMIKFDEGFKITNKSKKVEKNAEDGKLIYKCDKPTYIDEDGESYVDTTVIEVADVAKVASELNTKNLVLKNCDTLPLHGRVIFEKEQRVESLTIKNTAVRGKINASKVSIDGVTYLDLKLDADEEQKHTELIIRPNSEDICHHSLFMDEEGKNIRGNINLSIDFYNKLSKENKIKIREDCRNCAAHISIEGVPLYFYEWIKYGKIDMEEARRQLMRFNVKYAKALSADVEFEYK